MTEGLTDTEHRMLEMLVETGRIKSAAARLGLSEQYMKNVLLLVRRRVGAVSNLQLVYMMCNGDLTRE